MPARLLRPAAPRAGRTRYISVLQKTAESFKGSPFSYLWVQGGAHPALEANLDVGGFGYPGGAVVNGAGGRLQGGAGQLGGHGPGAVGRLVCI